MQHHMARMCRCTWSTLPSPHIQLSRSKVARNRLQTCLPTEINPKQNWSIEIDLRSLVFFRATLVRSFGTEYAVQNDGPPDLLPGISPQSILLPHSPTPHDGAMSWELQTTSVARSVDHMDGGVRSFMGQRNSMNNSSPARGFSVRWSKCNLIPQQVCGSSPGTPSVRFWTLGTNWVSEAVNGFSCGRRNGTFVIGCHKLFLVGNWVK